MSVVCADIPDFRRPKYHVDELNVRYRCVTGNFNIPIVDIYDNNNSSSYILKPNCQLSVTTLKLKLL